MEEIIKETEDNEEEKDGKEACENCSCGDLVDTRSSEYLASVLKWARS
jgi:hypothetical protein